MSLLGEPNIWSTHVATAETQVDHRPWQIFLNGATIDDRGITRISFSTIPGRQRAGLDQYVAWLATLNPSQWNRDQQLAYWLNLHNAMTVQVVADAGGRGDLDRFRQFPSATAGPFAATIVTVEGHPLSIDDIVDDVLRPNFAGVPFHYGLFTGAEGGPSLRRTAFTGTAVRAELDAEARRYVNGRGVRIGRRDVRLSSLYDWYGDDFGESDEAILNHVRFYAEGRLKTDLESRTVIVGYTYDFAIVGYVPRRVESEGFSPGSGPRRPPSFGGGS